MVAANAALMYPTMLTHAAYLTYLLELLEYVECIWAINILPKAVLSHPEGTTLGGFNILEI